MLLTLALLRHGRATGQGAAARLTPEGEAHLARLGTRLANEGWSPDAVFTSPFVRARASAQLVLARIAPALAPIVLDELTPETPPQKAIAALLAARRNAGRVVAVAHLPLLGLLAEQLTGQDPGFLPGTFVEIELASESSGRLLRRIGPEDLSRT